MTAQSPKDGTEGHKRMTTSPEIDTGQHEAAEPGDEYNENLIPRWPTEPPAEIYKADEFDPSPVPIDAASLPRLMRAECGAEPPHAPMWMEYDDEAWYPPSCPDCAYIAMRDAHAGCSHSHHGAWRRWKLVHWLAGWAYQLGLIASYGATYDGYCRGCLDGFRWRPKNGRPYALGWPTWKWGCLLKGRHWPGGYVGFGCCTKCLPCPECGSAEPVHDVLHGQDSMASERDEGGGGRHRLSPQHPGWETAPEELEALVRARNGE